MLPNDVLAQVAEKLKNKSWYEALVSLGLNLDEIKAIENVLVAKACFNEWKKCEPADDIDKLEILENVLDNYHLDEKVFGKYNGKGKLHLNSHNFMYFSLSILISKLPADVACKTGSEQSTFLPWWKITCFSCDILFLLIDRNLKKVKQVINMSSKFEHIYSCFQRTV